jgi:dTDP-4-amino-4,6-dideoxygalactose transaminase
VRTVEKLAVEGGTPVRVEPVPPRIVIGVEERAAVLELLDREMASGGGFDRYGGTEVDCFEREFAEHVGTRFATATSSGTAAIHSALATLHLEPGDEVISPPVTDAGAVMPIVWQGCIPVFADVDEETFNLDPYSVAERITPRTRALIVTHLAGQPADLEPLLALARRHQLTVIEDCAQAHDAAYHGKLVGGIGHIGAFSLMSGKHTVAGGQGGMVVTNDEEMYWNAKRFADRGKPFNSTESKNLFLGLNYRMTELEAAIGRVQLRKLPEVVQRRRTLAASLAERIADLETVRLGKVIDGVESAYWFLFLLVDALRLRVTKQRFAEAVQAEGLPVTPSYDHIVYDAPWLRDHQTFGHSGYPWSIAAHAQAAENLEPCPNARRAVASHILVSLHEGWTKREVDDLATALRKVEQAFQVD